MSDWGCVVKNFLLGREPALLLSLVAALLGIGSALAIPGLSGGQVALIMAAANAVLGAVQAAFVRPWQPAAFTAAVGALGALGAGYGFHASPGLLAALDAVVLAAGPLLVRGQVTPLVALRAAAAAHSAVGGDPGATGPRPVS